ncbi:hypothetical protein GCM10010495_68040 [Kitasatospora herbaricolor]|nr:hypothetical protein GCM10010495_68040 [Kitasatospora herbaricolor]
MLGQGEGAGSGPAAQVDDPAGAGPDGQPGDDRRGVLGEHLRVQVEQFRLVVGVVLGALVPVTVVLVTAVGVTVVLVGLVLVDVVLVTAVLVTVVLVDVVLRVRQGVAHAPTLSGPCA